MNSQKLVVDFTPPRVVPQPCRHSFAAMDFSAMARQAVYSTLSPEAALSPGMRASFLGASSPPQQGPAFNPLSPSDAGASSRYSDLVAAARAAVASLPTEPLPHLTPAPMLAASHAIQAELSAALERLHSLREAQARLSPPKLGSLLGESTSGMPLHRSRLAASDLGSSSSSSAWQPHTPGLRVSPLNASRTGVTGGFEAAAAPPASAASARPSAAAYPGSPVWVAPGTPRHQPTTASQARATSSGAPSPAPTQAAAAAAAAAWGRFSPIASPATQRPPPAGSGTQQQPAPTSAASQHLRDAHAGQRSAEALYQVASQWRSRYHSPEAVQQEWSSWQQLQPTPTLVSHALQGVAGGEEEWGSSSGGEAPTDPQALLHSLCAAAGLEPQQQGQLLQRVQDLARLAVAYNGLNAFAGRVSEQLCTRLVGLGEAWEQREDGSAGVRFGPLQALQEHGGPANLGLSQSEALLSAALTELEQLRAAQARNSLGGRR